MARNSEQGTGKHPHKKTEEPWPHNEQSSKQDEGQGGTGTARAREKEKGEEASSGEESDLKKREYKDSKGEVHHHTKTSGSKK